MYELIARLNGVNAAFAPLGRNKQGPRVPTSVSLFLFKEGRRLLHVLVDVGPGVPEAIEADDLFPAAFPLDWIVFSHGHADHCLGLDALCGDRHWWHKIRGHDTPPLRICCLPATWSDVVEERFPFQKKYLDHTAAAPGQAVSLWRDGDADLSVTMFEVAHYRQSACSVFSFRDGADSARVMCLFDIADFHPPGSPQAAAGAHADQPLFHKPDLFIGESTFWSDPKPVTGKPAGHINFEKLAGYLCQWQPAVTRIVHFAGFEHMWNVGGPQAYAKLREEGVRLHPNQGPPARWELTIALQQHMKKLGFAEPRSIQAGEYNETLLVYPRI